eukprot:scaffold7387_cov408-Prasinococcus_capsulatus_cf.AAC.20
MRPLYQYPGYRCSRQAERPLTPWLGSCGAVAFGYCGLLLREHLSRAGKDLCHPTGVRTQDQATQPRP